MEAIGGRCSECWCCSKCTEKCQASDQDCGLNESKDDIAMRVLGIDTDSLVIRNAMAFRREVEREEREYYSSDSELEADDKSDFEADSDRESE